MADIEKYYAKLREEVVQKVNRTMESPTDFDYLSAQIEMDNDEKLSASTLKRFFGYIPNCGIPSTSTLSILSRYIGYMGWKDFCEDVSESQFIDDYSISASDLTDGDTIRFEWMPNRVYEAQYKGHGRFVVTHAENGTLGVGDTFSASAFTINNPLYLNNIQRADGTGNAKSNYVAGYKTGLTHVEIIKKKS